MLHNSRRMLPEDLSINKGVNLVGLFVAFLCCLASEYSHDAFDDAPRQTTKNHDDIDTFIYGHLLNALVSWQKTRIMRLGMRGLGDRL